jgi:hypothetical protein
MAPNWREWSTACQCGGVVAAEMDAELVLSFHAGVHCEQNGNGGFFAWL